MKSKRILLWFLAVLLDITFACPVIRSHVLPHVQAVSLSCGRLSNSEEVYDCVIPKSAFVDGKLYFISPEETILGTTYTVYSREVRIIAEDETLCAVDLQNIDDDMVVIVHEGELIEMGEVIIYRS